MQRKYLYITNIITGIVVSYGATMFGIGVSENFYTENPCPYNPETLGLGCVDERILNYPVIYGTAILAGILIAIITSVIFHIFTRKRK